MMEEVRQLVQEEGREARNLVAFHVAVDTPARVARKPPKALPPARRLPPRATRLRSASAGRDKRSELRARYWALLFGDLQRSIGEIYNTVEAHENLNECQEVILVLENYTRDFKALGEWFRLKWEYDNTPPPQRPQSLAWEIRKTDFVRPESRRTHSVRSSPSVSGKNSPCLSGHNTPSGKNSPNLTGKASPGSGKISPRISNHSSSSPKGNVEFFSNKIVASKITAKPEPTLAKEATRLSDIKEKDFKALVEEDDIRIETNNNNNDLKYKQEKPILIEVGKATEHKNESPKQVVVISKKSKNKDIDSGKLAEPYETKSGITTKNAIENEIPTKNLIENKIINGPRQVILKSKKTKIKETDSGKLIVPESAQAKITSKQLDAMENEFLAKNLTENKVKNDNLLNSDHDKIDNDLNIIVIEQEQNTSNDAKHSDSTESPIKSEDNFADVSNESVNKFEVCHKSPDIKVKENNVPDTIENSLQSNKISNDIVHHDTTTIDTLTAVVVNCSDNILHGVNNCSERLDKTNVNEKHTETINEVLVNITASDATNTDTMKCTETEISENDGKNFGNENISIKEEISSKTEAKEEMKKEQELKKTENKSNTETKQIKPAYSQAAAKPKPVATKSEVKTPTRLVRSSTVVEIRPNTAQKSLKTSQKKVPASKCSYPFNLTTGRTSLFDAPSTSAGRSNTIKRPNSKNIQMAGGDGKSNINKVDYKKRPPRPTSLKVNDKPNKIEKVNLEMDKIKECKNYKSSDTIVTQIDMSRIESSESLKTLVPDDYMLQDISSSVEVLNVDKSDNEGWLTVKSRRIIRESKKQSKSHWANRFHQPSATTSLPTLSTLESPKQEVKIITDFPTETKDVAKPEQENHDVSEEIAKTEVVKPKTKSNKTKDSMVRQKSDVTGLKTRSSRSRMLKKTEKVKDEPKQDDHDLASSRLHSSLESLTTALAQETPEEPFDFDKWKAEFKSTLRYFEDDDHISDHNEILKSADPSEMSEIAEMTSQIEENERKMSLALDFQCEVDQRKLSQEEDLLNRQILELQQVSDIDIDTETDDTETDAEILCEEPAVCSSQETLGALAASLEHQYETALAGMSWAERVDTLVVLEALVARDPGRAQQLHAKLSQGIKRRGSLQDALRRLQAKQARAERQRMEYQTERAKKIHQLLARVEEVKVAKNQLIEEKRLRMERRLQKATENRDQHLKDIVRKAHDEEEKLREIAFIKQLEAENRRHEFLDQCRSHTTRLRQMRRDRLEKLEAKAAREAAVGERRAALEAARERHVAGLLQRRRERHARLELQRERERRRRGDAAREKAEGVRSRLSALAAAAELEADALRSRIRDKQDASQQRLESRLRAIRHRAAAPRTVATSEGHDQNINEINEMNEIDEEAEKLDQERKDKERQKAIKRRSRKLKMKLLASGNAIPVYEETISSFDPFVNPMVAKLCKVTSSLNTIVTSMLEEKTVEIEEEKPKKKKKSKANDEKSNDHDKKSKKNSIDEFDFFNEKESKRKKRKKNDGQNKLSKASSVCSSTSDMSKASIRSEKSRVLVDLPNLERQLNELYWVMEKIDKQNMPDKATVQRCQALKVLGDIFEIAAEKENLAPQLSARCLTTAVSVLSRAMVSCRAAALAVVATNTPVHLATLLAELLAKDIFSASRDLDLAMQLADCISISLDSVLCATRLHEEKASKTAEDTEKLAALRQRAHQIISYICINGCVTLAEEAGEVRESVQAMLTVCADLCQPCDADVGSERATARQSLRAALGKSICGSRAEFCSLFAKGANLEECDGFVSAARTAHLLRTIAEMDHKIIQEAFGEDGWPLEFRAAISRLLSQHAPSDKEAPRGPAICFNIQRLDKTLAETMVLDLITLIGFVVVNNPQMQESICPGWGVVASLCRVPAHWLVSRHRGALLPALAALAQCPHTAAAIAADLSMGMLDEFLESPEAQKIKLVQVIKQGKSKKTSGKK